jgi:4'-phosphopantetheinyl transferase EntD
VERIDGLFADLLDPSVVVSLSAPVEDRWIHELTEAEHGLVARSIDKRKREFATGRRLARTALATLGIGEVELLNGPDRAPRWPVGVHGSISHCDRRAVVAVTRAEHGTLGVDVEHRDELKRELWKTVFLPREIAELDAHFDATMRGRMALVLFSAKESLYKAQYPRTTTYMGFHELHVALEPDPRDTEAGALVCTFQNDVGPNEAGVRFARGHVARGRYRLDAFTTGEVVTSVFIP